MAFCSQCGQEMEGVVCGGCGARSESQQNSQQTQPYQQPMNQQNHTQYTASEIDPSWPAKSKVAAGVLGILLGGLGIHKFYMGKIGMGVLYLAFCWTAIPAIVGLIEGIIYLTTPDALFQIKHKVRIIN